MKRILFFLVSSVSLLILGVRGMAVDPKTENQSIEKPGVVIRASTNFMRAFLDENPRYQLNALLRKYPKEMERIQGRLDYYYHDEPIILQLEVINEGNVSIRRPDGGWFSGLRVIIESVDSEREIMLFDVSDSTPGPLDDAHSSVPDELLKPGEGVKTKERFSLHDMAKAKLAPGLVRVTVDTNKYNLETITFQRVSPRVQSPHIWIVEPKTPREKAIALCHFGYRAWLASPNAAGFKEAEPLLLKAIEVDNSIVCAKSYLASIYRKIGEYRKALPFLEELVKILKDDKHKEILEEVRRKVKP